MRSGAEIEYTIHENDEGKNQDAVFATCTETNDVVGPIWGHGHSSVLRALATLTEECSCGADFHFDVEADDDDDE